MSRAQEIRGRVLDETGEPVAGALVMGVDLGWAETQADGSFTIRNPEMALFFWCSGFFPKATVLDRSTLSLEVTMRTMPPRISGGPAPHEGGRG